MSVTIIIIILLIIIICHNISSNTLLKLLESLSDVVCFTKAGLRSIVIESMLQGKLELFSSKESRSFTHDNQTSLQ